ncbi:MAG: hypothetical protein COA43_08320 [Robiginitomaculum sp.]|nr:MAG: hypothetical protein COA43_08320 [Robiginitomaculum sp.]
MIDRSARNKMALSVRRLALGRITNWEYEEQISDSTVDTVIGVIDDEMWSLYNGHNEHGLVGKHEVSHADKKVIARIILFLKSDLKYEYPIVNDSIWRFFVTMVVFLGLLLALWAGNSNSVLLSLAVLGSCFVLNRETLKKYETLFTLAGDQKQWPFTSEKQLRETAKLLAQNRKGLA